MHSFRFLGLSPRLQKQQNHHKDIYFFSAKETQSELSRCSTAKGSCKRFSLLGPTKVMACKPFIEACWKYHKCEISEFNQNGQRRSQALEARVMTITQRQSPSAWKQIQQTELKFCKKKLIMDMKFQSKAEPTSTGRPKSFRNHNIPTPAATTTIHTPQPQPSQQQQQPSYPNSRKCELTQLTNL